LLPGDEQRVGFLGLRVADPSSLLSKEDHMRCFAVTVGAAALSLVCSTAGAQTIKQGTAPRIQSVQGVDSYKAYCAVCHGEQARGNGPAATALKKAPADLTTISKRHGGKFSSADVEGVITGIDTINSHGTRDMPIWGPVFQALAPNSETVKLRVANLVDYIKSIQTQ
jgi:mono/diheme cytochrome c family protein